MSLKTASRESKEQTRKRNTDAILAAAEIAFAAHGYRGASLSMIAEMAGLPKSNVTYYFQSKEALYKTVLSNICFLWLQAGDEINEDNEPGAALTSYIHDKLDLARNRPHGSRVWANEIMGGAKFIEEFLSSTVNDWLAQRAAVLDHWMSAGLVNHADPKIVFYMIWATTQHYADFESQILALNNNRPMSDDDWNRTKETVSSMILTGLGVASCDGSSLPTPYETSELS